VNAPSGPIAVLANPSAGRGRHHDVLPAVLERLRRTGCDVRVLEAADAEGAERAARDAVAGGAAALVAGAILVITAPSVRDTPVAVRPAIAPGFAGLSATGSF